MRIFLFLVVCIGFCCSEAAIKYLHVLSEIQSRFASTDIVSEIENLEGFSEVVKITAELPPNAFIRSFYLDRDGNITYGVIKAKELADQEFIDAKQQSKVAARLRQSNSKIFELEVNLPPRAHIAFNLTYQEVLHKSSYVYKHAVYVNASLPIKDLQINVLIADRHNFSTIHVPQFAPGINELPNSELLARSVDSRVILQAAGDTSGNLAYISYEAADVVDDGELVILYNTTAPAGQNEITVVDGFFLQQYTPSDDVQNGNKTVLFVLDKSGSMNGRKIEQLKTAMAQILRELQPQDRFNIILFDRSTKAWKPEPVIVTRESVDEAIEYINAVEAHGGTNIADALLKAVTMLDEAEKQQKSFLATIVFLTDGQPTVGLKHTDEILETLPENDYPIESIAFGVNASYSLLKQISGQHQGFAKRIFENAESDVQIAGFYNEMAYPIAKDVTIKYLDSQVDIGSVVSADESKMLFQGQELTSIGKLQPEAVVGSTNSINTTIEASLDEGPKTIDFNAPPVTHCVEESLLLQVDIQNVKEIKICGKTNTIGNFIERMWAQRTILKYERILETSAVTPEEKENVAERIKQLAMKYGMVTSQTSMVVVLENEKRALRQTDSEAEGEEEEDEFGEPIVKLQRAELGEEFRIPYDARKIDYPAECSAKVFIFVGETWSRHINRIRARRFGAEIVAQMPPLSDPIPGILVSNGTLVLEGRGDERELFKMVRENPIRRHILLLIAEVVPERTLQYIDALRPGLIELIVVSPFHAYPIDQKSLIKSLKRVDILESPKVLDVVKLLSC